MWKALHQLAIPERLYRLCGCWIPAGGVERAVAGHRPGVGLWLRPADYQQGKATGSCTFTSRRRCGRWGCTAMAVAAFVGVVWQIKMADLAIAALAPVGGLHLVALVSGAAWGKPMWGLVDLGRPPDLRAGAAVSVCRGHRPVARL